MPAAPADGEPPPDIRRARAARAVDSIGAGNAGLARIARMRRFLDFLARAGVDARDDRGDVPGWVLRAIRA